MRPCASGVSLVLGVRLLIGGSERGQRVTPQPAGALQQVCLLIHQPGELAERLRCRPNEVVLPPNDDRWIAVRLSLLLLE
jgi:hypothetical protein